jgi:hypothetical protein
MFGVTTKNPFPGMNPFSVERWRDAHLSLITYLRDRLNERLPPDLVARIEAEARTPEAPIERWLEIHEATGWLITVLELLSPSNKLESEDRANYLGKRRGFMEDGINLVEIDLVRQGAPVFPAPVRRGLQEAGACYGICVFRAARAAEQDVYPIRLRERLPAFRVPLRPTDSDVVVDLQPLIDQCHERGRYHFLNYRLALDPPLPPDDAPWAAELLQKAGLA